MTKQTVDTILQTGFEPRVHARARVWNRLQGNRVREEKRPVVRWAMAACLAVVIIWGASVWTPHEAQPMLAGVSVYETSSQRYGEAGPCGQEYNVLYVPFQ